MALPLGTDVEYVGSGGSGGVVLGRDADDLIGVYGKAPSAQRAFSSAVHVSSNLATSASFGATQLAAINEIQATLVALGIWATA